MILALKCHLNQPINEPKIKPNASLKTHQLIFLDKPKSDQDQLVWTGSIASMSKDPFSFNQKLEFKIGKTEFSINKSQFKTLGILFWKTYYYHSKNIIISIDLSGNFFVYMKKTDKPSLSPLPLEMKVDTLYGAAAVVLKCKNHVCKVN